MSEANEFVPLLSDEAKRVLGEALRAIEIYKADALIGDSSQCPTTDRIRTLAGKPTAIIIAEQQHVLACARCRARLRAFQSAMYLDSEYRRDAKLQQLRLESVVSRRWVSRADERARMLFERLHEARSGDVSYPRLWLLTDLIAHDLRSAVLDGGGDAELEFILATSLAAVTAEVNDVLSLWGSSLDSAWPLVELLRRAAWEIPAGSVTIQDGFAHAYACMSRDASPPLKAMLVHAADSNKNGIWPTPEFAARIAAAIALEDSSSTARILLALPSELSLAADHGVGENPVSPELAAVIDTFQTACDEIRSHLRRDKSWVTLPSLVPGIAARVFDDLFRATSALDALVHLKVVRALVDNLTSVLKPVGPDIEAEIFSNIGRVLVQSYKEARGPVFLLVDALAALRPRAAVYAEALFEMLRDDNARLRHGVVVALRNGYECLNMGSNAVASKFRARRDGWVFDSDGSDSLDYVGMELAELAQSRLDLADSFVWFNGRFGSAAATESITT